MVGLGPVLLAILYLGVMIYLLTLADRFVKAMERIAEKIGN